MDVEAVRDLKSVFKETVGEVLENRLDAELDYTKYDYRNKDTDNSRNGHSEKTVKTSAGEAETAVPRDRKSEFEPQIIRKNETPISRDKCLMFFRRLGIPRSLFKRHRNNIAAALSVLRWGNARCSVKNSAEIQSVVISHGKRYFVYIVA